MLLLFFCILLTLYCTAPQIFVMMMMVVLLPSLLQCAVKAVVDTECQR